MKDNRGAGAEHDGTRGGDRTLTAYQSLCSKVLLPVGDFLLGREVSSRFSLLQRFQWKSADEIHAYQEQRLRDLLVFSFDNVPFYHDTYSSYGIDRTFLERIEIADLHRLPILTKEHLRGRFGDLKVRGFHGRVEEMRSSGSTGTQTVVLNDNKCFSEVFATQLLFWSWGGFFVGEPHLQTGMSLNRGWLKALKDLSFRCTYVSAFELSDDALRQIGETIEERGIRALFGYASSIYVIARYLDREKITLPMASIFTWGDCLFPHYRQRIERVFACQVNDCYGLGEGLQCAAQCEQHDALHEAMHGVALEVTDSEGRPCPPGGLGRVVATRLEPGPMPLIRYDTGDLAHRVAGRCACGRQLSLLSRIQGRNTDIVSTPSGDRLIVHHFTQIFEMIPEIARFQIRQTVPDSIEVLYVPTDHFDASILATIRSQIHEHCQFKLAIQFRSVEDIPLERSNKRRFVISTVPLSLSRRD